MTMIAVESVTRYYGALKAVDAVSFGVERGEIVGFVGPNGAGKSTVLKMLSTFLLPSSGRILVDGLDTALQPLEVRQRIGYLSGDTPLYLDMRVDKFLLFVGRARGLRGADLAGHLERTVQTCGLQGVLLQRVGQCSTGYRQRIGLASALIHDPPILLLDEPTHGFDPMQVMAFRQLLRQLSRDRAVLFSTHIIADVEASSDRVLIIHQGRLLAQGRLPDLAAASGRPQAGLEELFAHLVQTSRGPDHA